MKRLLASAKSNTSRNPHNLNIGLKSKLELIMFSRCCGGRLIMHGNGVFIISQKTQKLRLHIRQPIKPKQSMT